MGTQAEPRDTAAFVGGYTLREAARLVDLSEGQVRAYVREGFLVPRRGLRQEYRLTFQDLVLLRTAKALSSELSERKVRRALRKLREQLPNGRALATVRLTAEGDEVVVHDGDTAWEPTSGQTLLNFEVAELATVVAPIARRQVRAVSDADLPIEADGWFELGCELETVALDEAVEAYRRTLELDSDYADAHVNLGRLLHQQGELGAAEEHYRHAQRLRPDDATASFNLGVLQQDRGDYAQAADAYRRTIELDPDYADAHFNLASVYEALQERKRALFHYRLYQRLVDA